MNNNDCATYAWTIDKDHLYDADEAIARDDAGTAGPHDAPDELMARLDAGEGHEFTMYDDDGELYYTGRLVTDADMGDEQHCAGPLYDYGMGNAGCTEIRWTGHSEWDCG